ncbi:unnamed protein product [Anisakis simplex]|uniref:YopX domain-containing protein n=1 Tax=Anisakis simplex TaxID=6269 RepID=A0A0M3JWE4_ANISI|nr:unnamed protein product [Anisakis simplex]
MIIGGTFGSVQKYIVEGHVVCSMRPLENAWITLYDYDVVTLDDLMGQTLSDENGYFLVSGEEDELFRVEAYIVISHSCVNGSFFESNTPSTEREVICGEEVIKATDEVNSILAEIDQMQ